MDLFEQNIISHNVNSATSCQQCQLYTLSLSIWTTSMKRTKLNII